MDCEKFDLCVMDALYDELDELTYAALKRHIEGCSRCNAVFSALRATREVGVLPLVEPPVELEARILEAAFAAQKSTPLRRKVLRGLAWAGSHAMRPQLAMAALFFLVIGSSLLLMRARPGSGGPLRVTERGAPGPEEVPAAQAEPASPPVASAAPAAAAATAMPVDALAEGQRKGEGKDAEGRKDGKEKADDGKSALAEARTLRDRSGCAAAVGKFDEVGARFPATAAAADAMYDEASCYKSLGEAAKARELLLALKANPSYRDRVESELAAGELANSTNNGPTQQRAAAGAAHARAAPMPAPAPPAAQAASPPATSAPAAAKPSDSANGGTGRAVAAPKRALDPAGF